VSHATSLGVKTISIQNYVSVLLTVMVCDKDTTANGPAMGGLSRCVLKGTRTVLRGGRGSDASNLPDVTKIA